MHSYFIDCSAPSAGDGSEAHPWNALAAAEVHSFAPGDRIALARGTVCHGSFAPKGSGTDGHVIRLTAYGQGARPRIVAPASAQQILLLFNQQYWQVDSLDLSGANTYGVFVTGDKGILHHLYLKNLYVHDVYGGTLKNKDNGLVIVGPGSINIFFDDVLIDGVDAAHTNQWAGILVGGGNFPYRDDAPLNTNVQIRNSTVHDVFGDGIVLFRDRQSAIETSAAWLTGMQPTQDIGTPNAIWTWTCDTCRVNGNEAYLTDSPGVDGGAYDIDWNNRNNTVSGNYAHDTQGYCIAVFGAGYVTSDSEVTDNLCIDNGLSPRMAALQGAIYLSTWNGGVLRGVVLRGNTILWNPRNPGTAAIVSKASIEGHPIEFMNNTVESTSPLIYRIDQPFDSADNAYRFDGTPLFSVGGKPPQTLETLQSAGMELRSTVKPLKTTTPASSAQADAILNLQLGDDGLLADETRTKLIVLRSMGGQYSARRLRIMVHLPRGVPGKAEANALRDLEDVYPGVLNYVRDIAPGAEALAQGTLHIKPSIKGQEFDREGAFDAAAIGRALHFYLGPPDYSHMQPIERQESPQ
ncbi:MAG TPA: right-handed parallel beta-helix repeat-containing protein [Terracidiphilus sp.]|nr:right-handed parallel beta-helix repeat-containing protein [Terracidiphilus sp.]